MDKEGNIHEVSMNNAEKALGIDAIEAMTDKDDYYPDDREEDDDMGDTSQTKSLFSDNSRISGYVMPKWFFENPRNNCIEISPYLTRLRGEPTKSHRHWEERLHKMFARLKIPKADQHIQHMQLPNIDASDRQTTAGVISSNIYKYFCNNFRFDLYGRPIHTPIQRITKHEKRIRKILEGSVGSGSTKEGSATSSVHRMRASQDSIGYAQIYHAPVGLKQSSTLVSRSHGNEAAFSYRGEWQDGEMHGKGEYFYKDGETYRGSFQHNKACGQGVAMYMCGSSYEGHWKDSLFDGRGKLSMAEGDILYEGGFGIGRREGIGMLTLPCGLIYKGDYLNGKPHGRGVMTSSLSGYSYDGNFDRGVIHGTGTLICPDGKRVALNTEVKTEDGYLLPTLVRNYLKDVDEKKQAYLYRMEELTKVKRGLALQDYLQMVRKGLSSMRDKEYAEDVKERKRIYQKNRKAMAKAQKKLYEEVVSSDSEEDKDNDAET